MQPLLRGLDRVTRKSGGDQLPAHLRTGRRGEEDAYFYLRRKGYVMVARNYRTARHRGEIDLIGWAKIGAKTCSASSKSRLAPRVMSSPHMQPSIARSAGMCEW